MSELARPFSMTLAAVVQHVQVLEAAGLVTTQKIGRVRTVQIDTTGVRGAEAWLAARRTRVESQLDRLAEVLAETAPEPPTEPPTHEQE